MFHVCDMYKIAFLICSFLNYSGRLTTIMRRLSTRAQHAVECLPTYKTLMSAWPFPIKREEELFHPTLTRVVLPTYLACMTTLLHGSFMNLIDRLERLQ